MDAIAAIAEYASGVTLVAVLGWTAWLWRQSVAVALWKREQELWKREQEQDLSAIKGIASQCVRDVAAIQLRLATSDGARQGERDELVRVGKLIERLQEWLLEQGGR